MRHRFLGQVVLVYGLVAPLRGQSPLLDAIRKDDVAAVEKLLEKGMSPNPSPSLINPGTTGSPLMLAAQRGNNEMVRTLLKHKADPNIRTRSGDSPLRYAVGSGSVPVVALLLQAGAAPDFPPGDPPLKRAIEAGNQDIVNILLSRGVSANGIWANREGNEETPLMIAARADYVDVVRTLLAHGASVNFRTENQGQTALAVAESAGRFEIAALLLSAGANQGDFPRVPQSGKSIRERIPALLQQLYWRLNARLGAALLTGGALEDWNFIDRRWSPLKPLDPTYRMNLTAYVYSLESALREPDETKAYSRFQDLAADLRIKANHCRATGSGLGGLVNVIVKTQRGNAEVGAWQVFWKPKILEFAKQYRAEAFPQPSSPTSQELAPGRYLMWAQDPATGKRGNEEVVTIGEGKKALDKTLFVPN